MSVTIAENNPLYPIALYIQQKEDVITQQTSTIQQMQGAVAETNKILEETKNLAGSLQVELEQLRASMPKPVEKEPWEIKADAIIDTAKYLLERHLESGQTLFPYDFGAVPKLNEKGEVVGGTFDCSSFTDYCYTVHGYPLPRTSYNQDDEGTYVTKLQARKGDLIAFNLSSTRDTPNGTDHVAIYLGDNKIIHSNPSGKGINIRDVGSWADNIVTIRRIIT